MQTLYTVLCAVLSLLLVICLVLFLPACSVNGTPMRPTGVDGGPLSKSPFIESKDGKGKYSCSFVEFDERGDFLDFNQHVDCEKQIEKLVESSNRVMLVIYCHGWKNSSQSNDVVKFNAFLSKMASDPGIQNRGLRVHGVYIGWRGNVVRPYVPKDGEAYQQTLKDFGAPIVDDSYHLGSSLSAFVPENLSYWNRKDAAENKASGLPMARAIFTYAAAAKSYGKKLNNRVFVLGHSFGALMLERSLGQAMTGALIQRWYETDATKGRALPFDTVLLVNSAAPAIYAKEMRDFLQADRNARSRNRDETQDAPVIISLTSTADDATGTIHPIGNLFSPFSSSLQRRYTTGIFGDGHRDPNTGKMVYPTHDPVRQSEFYKTTPGHNTYLINHWIVKDPQSPAAKNITLDDALRMNLDPSQAQPESFVTSGENIYPPAKWEITQTPPPGEEKTQNGLKLSMHNSNYWVVECGKEIIASHGDIWSDNALETYAALFRLSLVKSGKSITAKPQHAPATSAPATPQ